MLLVGAALGVAAFAAEQRAFVWDPNVRAAPGGGWVVTGSSHLPPASPALASGRLVWTQGAYTCVLELESGDTHVVGAAARGSTVWPAVAGVRYIAWIEIPRSTDGGSLWVYDADRGRRRRFAVGRAAATPAVAGDLVAWYDVAPDGRPQVQTIDMGTERRAVLAEGAGIDLPVLGGDGVVAWLTRTGSGPAAVLRESSSGRRTTVPLTGSGAQVGDLRLAGRMLLWTLTSASETRVVVFDLDSRATSVVSRDTGTMAATDGAQVVWTSDASPSTPSVVRGLLLTGGAEYEVGRPAGAPKSLAAGAGWVAWVVDDGGATRLAALPVRRGGP